MDLENLIQQKAEELEVLRKTQETIAKLTVENKKLKKLKKKKDKEIEYLKENLKELLKYNEQNIEEMREMYDKWIASRP